VLGAVVGAGVVLALVVEVLVGIVAVVLALLSVDTGVGVIPVAVELPKALSTAAINSFSISNCGRKG
jgi:hypothetical protein